jgi:hypothetical protein
VDAGDQQVHRREVARIRSDPLGAQSEEPGINGLKTWMAVHHAAIMTVLLLVLGAKLIGDAIAGLYG